VFRLLAAPLGVAIFVASVILAGLVIPSPPGTLLAAFSLFLLYLCLSALLAIAFTGWFYGMTVAHGLRAVGQNGFGFCSGMAKFSAKGGESLPSLAEWLHNKFQALAGLPAQEPLCFGDLWLASSRGTERSREEAFKNALAGLTQLSPSQRRLADLARDIDLALVGSDISRAQSIEFPFLRRQDQIYVRISDLHSLFPDDVVNWMRRHEGTRELDDVDLGGLAKDDLIRLPPAQDLPIIFAVRISLSFPFLFRAVRLYAVRRTEGGGKALSELWLADGGITSNFPIHLFDAPIPSRPTFCINLLYSRDELQPDNPAGTGGVAGLESAEDHGLSTKPAGSPTELVYMLRSNYGRLAPYARLPAAGVGSLLRFGMRIVSTARQWNDNLLLDVPGYRDRIVHVRMRDDEGGFNFAMDGDKIADLQARGERAGSVIADRFLPTTEFDPLRPTEKLVLNWANHRMVRFRSFLAGLEVTASRFDRNWQIDRERAESLPTAPGHIEPSVAHMTEAARPTRQPGLSQRTGYPFQTNGQAGLALNMVKALQALAQLRSSEGGVDFWRNKATSPRPKQRLVLRPPLNNDSLGELPARPYPTSGRN
jgi:hypothetical protein